MVGIGPLVGDVASIITCNCEAHRTQIEPFMGQSENAIASRSAFGRGACVTVDLAQYKLCGASFQRAHARIWSFSECYLIAVQQPTGKFLFASKIRQFAAIPW